MRTALLDMLGNSAQADKNLLKSVCTCISAVATVEVPTGNWPEFMGVMSE